MSQRYEASVVQFNAQRGFGSLELEVPDDETKDKEKVFVHWKEIQTDDRWPTLEAGMKVECSIEKGQREGFKAVKVTLPGGDKITVTRNKNAETIAGEHSGTVTFFDYQKGFGFIDVDGTIPGVELEKGLHVTRDEIVTDDIPPSLKIGSKVHFTVFKNDMGFHASNVTDPSGKKIHNPRPPMRWNNNNNQGWSGQKRQRNEPGGWGGGGGRGAPFRPRQRPWRHMYVEENPEQQMEVGLFVKKLYVGGLIGKKGVVIKEMKKDSGASMQFGDEDIYFNGEAHRVMALSGQKEQVASACKMVATRTGEAAQSIDHKITYLVPEETLGMLIGKKGSNLNKIKGTETSERVRVQITQEAIQLPGANRVNMCSIYGGQSNVARAIDAIVETLGWISQRVQLEQQQVPPPPYNMVRGGPWGRGRGHMMGQMGPPRGRARAW